MVVKACRLELRQLSGTISTNAIGIAVDEAAETRIPSIPVMLDLPIRGRISTLVAFRYVYSFQVTLAFGTLDLLAQRMMYLMPSFLLGFVSKPTTAREVLRRTFYFSLQIVINLQLYHTILCPSQLSRMIEES